MQRSNKFRFIRNWKFSPGFSLIETLVVMLVLVTIGSIILSIFIIALTGTSKSHAQQIVRENGNYALSQISRSIQYAKSFNYVATRTGDYKDSCYAEIPEEQPIKYKSVGITTFDNGDIIFACEDVDGLYTIASSDKSLINTDKIAINEEDDTSCYFTCTQESIADPPTIGIHFELSPKNVRETVIPFDTSVVFRNY